MSSSYRGYLAVVLSSGLFALVALLTKFAYSMGMTPGQILTTQAALSAGLLLIYSLWRKPGALRITRQQALSLLLQALIGSLGTSYLFSYALFYIPAALGTMLLFTYPVLVTLGAFIFWKDSIRRGDLVALICAVLGIILSTQVWQVSSGSVQFKGIIFGLAAAVCYTFFILYGERILRDLAPLTTLLYVQVFSSLFLLTYRLVSNRPGEVLFATTPAQFLIGLLLATIASIMPLWLLLIGIQYIGATKASIVGTLELPITFALAFIFLHEQFGLWQSVGAILIITSILVVRLRDLKPVDQE